MKTKIAIASLLLISSLQAFGELARESGSFRGATGLQIRYISIGTGIDHEVKKQIEGLLVSAKVMRQVEYVKISDWGMEGESTECVQFRDVNDVISMKDKIDDIVKGSRLIQVTLKNDCAE